LLVCVEERRPDPRAGRLAAPVQAGFRHSALAVATVALLCAAAWLALNVGFNYGGHFTGLFYTGSKTPLPAAVGGGHTFRVQDEAGYDGQYYHLVAHDPLIRRGFLVYVDNPSLRWRRIGVPALACLLAAGSDRYVDYVYVTLQLVAVFLGTLWLSRYSQAQRRHATLGLVFLLVPAVLVSLDRMTVDLPLAALSIGFVLYAAGSGQTAAPSRWPVYAILCAAPLVRETGMILPIAWCSSAALRRNWRAASYGLCCGFPAVAWWLYVYKHTPFDGTRWLSGYPFSGIVARTVQGIHHPNSTLWLQTAGALEELALAGIWIALLLGLYLAWKRRSGPIEMTAIVFTAFAAALGRFDLWESAYATARTMSPLLIMLMLIALRDRRRVFALPLLLVLPRLMLQYEAQLRAVVLAFRS
jgi:hypothetical protein